MNGLQEPEGVIKATEQYREQEDWLQRFLESETERAERPEHRTQAREVYARYKDWAEDAKEYVHPERKFNEAMDGHGVESSKVNNKKMYHLVLKNRLANFVGRSLDTDRMMALDDGEAL